MERIKQEVIKFTVSDIETLIKKHVKDVEKLTGEYEISWESRHWDNTSPGKLSRGATLVEVTTKCAVATGPIA